MGDELPADGEGAGGGVGAPADEVGIVQRCGASTAGRDWKNMGIHEVHPSVAHQ